MLIHSASVVAQVLRECGGHHIIHVHHYIKGAPAQEIYQ